MRLLIINILLLVIINIMGQNSIEYHYIYNCDSDFTKFSYIYDNISGELNKVDSCMCDLYKTPSQDGVYKIYANDSSSISMSLIVVNQSITERKIWNRDNILTFESLKISDEIFFVREYHNNGNLKSQKIFMNEQKKGYWLYGNEDEIIYENLNRGKD